ncbi:hypothetical protein [Erythrobacter sp.]|uniref:hypothetical protein n=1 Tax=Erythrobacter sp. TaxID=1042 RepID=UPI001426010A|nr:hypothetical protein [Erythrobacter sp.]QIQ87551.1 MAG: hypothetical protein G9473_13310 [Erythrobacter sp.]
MSSDPISRRNRNNAKRSTGPKSKDGKAKVARNAQKHGATTQPDPASVATWLAIILDQPEIMAQDLIPTGDQAYRALALARADARLIAAENALLEFEQHHANVSPREELGFDEFVERVLPACEFGPNRHARVTAVLELQYSAQLSQMAHERRERRRLLKRYLSEAKSKRRKAFAAWLEISQREAAKA